MKKPVAVGAATTGDPVVIYTKGGHPVWPAGPRPKIGGEAVINFLIREAIRLHPDPPNSVVKTPKVY
jgi:hypothetical protein